MTQQKLIDWAVLLLRIVAGYLFVLNGGVKLFGWFNMIPDGTDLPTLLVVAGIIELVAGILIAIGLFTRSATFISAGQMAVAYFMAHVPTGFWYEPVANDGQPSVLLCFIFLFFAAYGAGIWSVDEWIGMRRRR